MLCIVDKPTGRMGNRLFHYHFMRQVASKSGLGFYHITMPDKCCFEGFGKKRAPFFNFRKRIHLSSKQILEFTPDEFIAFVFEMEAQSVDIALDPPILGELFYDYLFSPPSDFIEVKSKFKKPLPAETENGLYLGFHFRGTDFADWNSNAVLKTNYYLKALQACCDEFGEGNLQAILCTDDKSLSSYLSVQKFLTKNRIRFHNGSPGSLPVYDFHWMSQCEALISSPSTFSVWAGILGKEKKIIHSKDWLDYSIAREDKFWVQLNESKSPYYSLWQTF